ncbi:hypothetical protein ACFYT3_31260 [Nocardia amikacinitolerans]|uniref:hypothetical protein n=1 Tax=Nocardia amikacinitolerans TaxID=756689 RepID=UPI0036962EF3
MIASAAELVTWIRTNLPDLDEDRYHPWQAEPPVPGALWAHVQVRIRTPDRPDAVTSLTLSAAPIHDEPQHRAPHCASAPPTESR